MKARLNITIDEELLNKIKTYADSQQYSVSQLVEDFFKKIISMPKKKSLYDIMSKLPTSKIALPENLNLKKEYYKNNSKKYGFKSNS